MTVFAQKILNVLLVTAELHSDEATPYKRGHLWSFWGCPGGAGGKESTCQCRRHRFDPWIGKMPWSRKWQSTSVFLPGKFQGQRSLTSCSSWDHKRVGHNLVTKQQFAWVVLIKPLCEGNLLSRNLMYEKEPVKQITGRRILCSSLSSPLIWDWEREFSFHQGMQ